MALATRNRNMAKKHHNTRRELHGGGAATNSSRAKKAAINRRGGAKVNKDPIITLPSTNQILFLLAALAALVSTLLGIAPLLPQPTYDLVGDINNDDQLLKTRDFLSNYVCNYKPKAPAADVDVDIDGYCHPKLVAVPKERTQRIAYDEFTPESLTASDFYSRIMIVQQWCHIIWNKLFTTNNNSVAIPAGKLVMRLPRPLQIWDLDALRDEFIQAEFLGDKLVVHRETGNPLDSGAYLAVHLIRLIHGLRSSECSVSGSQECKQPLSSEWTDMRQYEQRLHLLKPYLEMLPTRNSDEAVQSTKDDHDHPLLWSKSTLESLFPKFTHTYDLIMHYRRMIQSEYDALCQESTSFAQIVEFSDYLNMRVNVLSRAFGVSASEDDRGAGWSSMKEAANVSLLEELKSYETSNFGTYLDKSYHSSRDTTFKLRAMSPLLDMYNSHPNPNVLWRYNEKTSSYDIRASDSNSLSPGDALMVSYGKYTEGHLFTKFGYVNGDGSSPTETNLAVFHRPFGDIGLGRQYSLLPFHQWDNISSPKQDAPDLENTKQVISMQSKELIRYLIFDDGYKECIRMSNDGGYNPHEELKLLKLKHLIRIANQREAWIVRLPEKFPDAKPMQTLLERPEPGIETNKVGVNAKRILSTCRLLSLTVNDIGSRAVDYLRDGLALTTFEVEMDGPTLEFRAMMCAARMCGVAMKRYGDYFTPKGRQEPIDFGSREWNAWYVREGEMRVLGILRQTLLAEANKLKRRHNLQNDDAIIVREKGACPMEYSLPLLSKI